MRRTWLGVRGVPRGSYLWGRPTARAAWLALVAAIGGWRCAVDDRSPKDVVASEMPSSDGMDGTRFSKVPTGGAAGSGALAQTGGAAGNGPTGSSGMGSGGTDSGAAGAGTAGAANGGSAGSAMTGNSAGSTGMTPPPGAGGAPPGGDLPDDPFGGLGDDLGGTTSTGSSNSTCPSFDACGGALEGTWTYANVCIDPSENSADLLQTVCPTASVTYERGGTATLTFTGSSVSRTGEPLGDSVITFPAECVEGLGCSFLADALGTSANCTDSGGDCLCRTASSVDWGTQSYTTAGGRLSLADGRSFDYCVQGNTLTYRETGDIQEAGTSTLQRN